MFGFPVTGRGRPRRSGRCWISSDRWGRAALLGLDSHRDALEIHRRVGYLPGDFSAYRRMTGRGYLEFFAALRGLGPSSFDGLADRLACDLEPRISSLSPGTSRSSD